MGCSFYSFFHKQGAGRGGAGGGGSFGDCVRTVMSGAVTLLHHCLQLRRNMSGDACRHCYFFQICMIGLVDS